LHRTTRRQGLTEAGRVYFEQCRAILADVAHAEASINDLHSVPRGKLRITAPVYFGIHRLAPAVSDFMRAYPDVEIDLVLSDQVMDLISGSFDAAFRIGPVAEQDVIAVPLAEFCLVLCASPAYLAAHGTPNVPADLAQHECFGCTPPTGPVTEFVLQGPAGEERIPIHSRCRVNECHALRRFALDGLGIVQVAAELTTEELATGRLVQVLPGYRSPSRPLHLLYMPDRRPTTALRSFVDFARNRLAG
jgi:DNA-binding transcriptional LysR family regulator